MRGLYWESMLKLQSSTQGNTRHLGSPFFGSHRGPRKPSPHTWRPPYCTHTPDTAPGSTRHCRHRLFHFLCRCLHERETQLVCAATGCHWILKKDLHFNGNSHNFANLLENTHFKNKTYSFMNPYCWVPSKIQSKNVKYVCFLVLKIPASYSNMHESHDHAHNHPSGASLSRTLCLEQQKYIITGACKEITKKH